TRRAFRRFVSATRNFGRVRLSVPLRRRRSRTGLSGEDLARSFAEQPHDFVFAVALFDVLHSGEDLRDVARAVCVAARRVIEALLEQPLSALLGLFPVFADERCGVEECDGSGFDELFEPLVRLPKTAVT